jgi:hypothetical protein
MKHYESLELRIIFSTNDDVITASVPNLSDQFGNGEYGAEDWFN